MKKHLLSFAGVMIVLLGFGSCQSARELHYFKQNDNYFRLKIKEYAFLSSSRYTAGYFDEHAVDTYFGEITRPDSAKMQSKSPLKKVTANGVESMDNKNLVLLLSTNAQAVTDQISAFAENEQMLEIVARLANSDLIDKNASLKVNLNTKKNSLESIITSGDSYIQPLDTAKTANANTYLLAFINSVAAIRGVTEAFGNMEEAIKWYRNEF
jgi:hypothetical protein